MVNNSAAVTGGAGGAGGSAVVFGGNGGAGGNAITALGDNITITNSAAVTGGTGGAAGSGGSGNGNAGNGGRGISASGNNITIINSATVTGGDGSAVGNGAGAEAIAGSNLTVINSGTLAGGFSGDGVTRANAVPFSAGTNTLELQAGSNIIGNVIAFSTADTFRLGGIANASFDGSLIGRAVLDFGIFLKTGSSTWTFTGTNAAVCHGRSTPACSA